MLKRASLNEKFNGLAAAIFTKQASSTPSMGAAVIRKLITPKNLALASLGGTIAGTLGAEVATSAATGLPMAISAFQAIKPLRHVVGDDAIEYLSRKMNIAGKVNDYVRNRELDVVNRLLDDLVKQNERLGASSAIPSVDSKLDLALDRFGMPISKNWLSGDIAVSNYYPALKDRSSILTPASIYLGKDLGIQHLTHLPTEMLNNARTLAVGYPAALSASALGLGALVEGLQRARVGMTNIPVLKQIQELQLRRAVNKINAS